MTTAVAEVFATMDASFITLMVVTLVAFLIPILIIFPPLPVEHSDALRQTHYKLGVPQDESNLRDQLSVPKHEAKNGIAARIQSLHIYPIKSCKGVELTEAKVLPKGLELDRLYTLTQKRPMRVPIAGSDEMEAVDGWEILTLRQIGLLANVIVDVWLPDPNKKSRLIGHVDEGFLVVRFPWNSGGLRGLLQTLAAKLSRGAKAVSQKEFMLPLEFPRVVEIKAKGYTYEDVKVFSKSANALNMSTELPPELAEYLGATHPVGLFRMDPSNRRQVFRCAPTKEDAGYQPTVDFQDGYPLHILSLNSVRALESKVNKDNDITHLDARRFRPNIILSGLPAYDEDDWKAVRFYSTKGDDVESQFAVSCRTVR